MAETTRRARQRQRARPLDVVDLQRRLAAQQVRDRRRQLADALNGPARCVRHVSDVTGSSAIVLRTRRLPLHTCLSATQARPRRHPRQRRVVVGAGGAFRARTGRQRHAFGRRRDRRRDQRARPDALNCTRTQGSSRLCNWDGLPGAVARPAARPAQHAARVLRLRRRRARARRAPRAAPRAGRRSAAHAADAAAAPMPCRDVVVGEEREVVAARSQATHPVVNEFSQDSDRSTTDARARAPPGRRGSSSAGTARSDAAATRRPPRCSPVYVWIRAASRRHGAEPAARGRRARRGRRRRPRVALGPRRLEARLGREGGSVADLRGERHLRRSRRRVHDLRDGLRRRRGPRRHRRHSHTRRRAHELRDDEPLALLVPQQLELGDPPPRGHRDGARALRHSRRREGSHRTASARRAARAAAAVATELSAAATTRAPHRGWFVAARAAHATSARLAHACAPCDGRHC